MTVRVRSAGWLVILIGLGGCQNFRPSTSISRLAQSARSVIRPADREESRSRQTWDWATAIPLDAKRAEVVPTSVPPDVLAALVPQLGSEIQLASAVSGQAEAWGVAARVVEADGHRITNCAQLDHLVEQALARRAPTKVSLTSHSGGQPGTLEMQPLQLAALSNAIAPAHPTMRVEEEGVPGLWIRDGATRCRLMVRAERSRGVLQLVLSLGTYWGEQQLLPVDIRARCDGESLLCLDATSTLNRLYGLSESVPQSSHSFALVAESEDYNLPTSYKLIQESIDESASLQEHRRAPALLPSEGNEYPGPAALGDARALAAMLLRQQLYEPGESERIGWVLFAGDALKDGGEVTIELDLGSGPQTLTFRVPST